MPARVKPVEQRLEIADHLIRALVADAHEDGGRCGELLVAADVLCERVHAGNGIAAEAASPEKPIAAFQKPTTVQGRVMSEEEDEKRSRRRCAAAPRRMRATRSPAIVAATKNANDCAAARERPRDTRRRLPERARRSVKHAYLFPCSSSAFRI